MVELTQLLYKNFESCTTNLGFNSNWFHPSRGLHQDCPASSLYFLCIVEILGQNIRNNEEITGIRIGNEEYRSGQFPDDTLLFLDFEQNTIQAAIDTLENFEKNSGLKLNYDKSNVCRIGSLAKSDAQLYTTKTLNWTNETITVFGIEIYHKKDNF